MWQVEPDVQSSKQNDLQDFFLHNLVRQLPCHVMCLAFQITEKNQNILLFNESNWALFDHINIFMLCHYTHQFTCWITFWFRTRVEKFISFRISSPAAYNIFPEKTRVLFCCLLIYIPTLLCFSYLFIREYMFSFKNTLVMACKSNYERSSC